jgi:hypothetical protein
MSQERWMDPRCAVLPTDKLGPFAELSEGRLMVVEENTTRISQDDGRTWSEPSPIYEGPGPGRPGGGVLQKTHDGVLVYVYMDMETYQWAWDNDRKEPAEDVRLDVWAIRSLDEGRTWVDRQPIFEGYCGALINIVQTRSGHLVVPVQRLLRDPGRHAQCTYVSADNGQTWQRSNVIDLGGHGHHDGVCEGTVVELQDGRLWMLLRTNWDCFWEAYSSDHGLSWRVIQPGPIDTSSAPGYLARLSSGRLALVWNRLYPEGAQDYPRSGGDGNLSDQPASWHREELSLAFSEDDGQTWTPPVVFARDQEGLSYPYLFERRPGELWITTLFQGKLRLRLREADFVG